MDMAPPTPPRMVTQWYTDAIAVLEQCRQRVEAMHAPVVQDDLVRAKELAQALVRIDDPDAR